jgi:hypothetical protein
LLFLGGSPGSGCVGGGNTSLGGTIMRFIDALVALLMLNAAYLLLFTVGSLRGSEAANEREKEGR